MCEDRFLHLAVPGVRGLTPYQPGKPIEELQRELGLDDVVKLASNENPLGPGRKAMEAIEAVTADLARYPDGNGFELKAALADHHGIDPACITLGNGSNDVLDLIARVFLAPGAESVFSRYAFAVYPIVSQAAGAVLRVADAHAPSHPQPYGHDLDAMAALVNDNTRVVWVANPNNPTGTWLTADTLRAFIERMPAQTIVVVDEAYFEYVQNRQYPDATRWLDQYPNLIVTRTFSKAHGLAGLRVGYALSSPAVADLLNRVRQPFNVNLPAQVAALASLQDQEHIQRTVELNRAGLHQLADAFDAEGLGYIPSVGNFITVDTGRPAGPVYEAMLREGVIVRPVANYGLPNHLRITVGTEQENRRCIEALKTVLFG
jgi:histidinol-phosphate aminotransferase